MVAVALIGCGGDTGGPALSPVKGVIKYKGAPVKGAAIAFIGQGGQVAMGTSDDSGNFTLTTNGRPGAPHGPATVTASKFAGGQQGPTSTGELKPEDMMKMQKAQMGQAEGPKNELPMKYADPKTSGLTADVVQGSAEKNSFEFNLAD